MKKLVLLFTALLSVAVLNSCSDDDSDNNNTNNNNTTTPTTASVITVTNLKSYVGQSNAQVSSAITSKGYALASTENDGAGTTTYTYSNNSATSGASCAVAEYNNVIYAAIYGDAGMNRTSSLPKFTLLSSNAYSLYTNSDYTYMGTIICANVPYDFDTHQNFFSTYNSFTSFESCSEMYAVDSDTTSTQAMISYQEINAKTTYCAISAMYVNYLLSPQSINKSNIKEKLKIK